MKKLFSLIFLLLFWCTHLSSAEAKTIGIFTLNIPGSKTWDPESIHTGITGSEEAIIYMSEQLAKLGYKVTVLCNPPANSPYSSSDSNPRYVSLASPELHHFDIGISWRMPKDAKRIGQYASQVYLWPHDICVTRLSDEQINGFQDVLWLSEWQREQWCSLNPGLKQFTKIFGNGIKEDQFPPLEERKNPYSCIYGSNYGRGLEILLDIWPAVKHQFPKATLDIYYGWQHWGILTKEQESKMRKQVDTLYRLDVNEHGLVSHEDLTKAYSMASFWTYPCTEPETFCITALKAQMAGAIPVTIDGSALKETVRNGYRCSNRDEYMKTLLKAMEEVETFTLEKRKHMGDFIRENFTWEKVALKWKSLFELNEKKAAKKDKPKIFLYTKGQLGNKLFEVATACAVAWDHDAEPLFPNISPSSNEGKRVFFRCSLGPTDAKPSSIWHGPIATFTQIPFSPNMCLDGYFQSEKYFAHHRDRILKLFEPHPDDMAYIQKNYSHIINNPHTVGVQLRYYKPEDPSSSTWPQFGKDYLKKAMALFPVDSLFVVSSNNIQFARASLPDFAKNVIFLENEPNYIDLFILSQCQHNIISNSSFGWWAAWLNKNPKKIVVRPSPLFYGFATDDYCPESWIAVEAATE